MKKVTLKTKHQKLLADAHTPVSLYLSLRDHFAKPILLESTDYKSTENSYSYIGLEPLASLTISDKNYQTELPGSRQNGSLQHNEGFQILELFKQQFQVEHTDFPFISNGLFGFMSYDCVQYLEDINININPYPDNQSEIPNMVYYVYRFLLVMDHNKHELHFFEHTPEGSPAQGFTRIETLINRRENPSFKFKRTSKESSNFKDSTFLQVIKKGISHCKQGDVLQVVLSRKYQCDFSGDDFAVYRALRSINPSPYLFYFDFGSYKIFGSSPEAQLLIQNRKATLHPIAGTFKRSGNTKTDEALAKALLADPKENAEHVMLVDLARNDLSRASAQVKIEAYKEIQYYSHLIHLVSKVSGPLASNKSSLHMVSSTFPAGTLSGAPKVRAMELINHYERGRRGCYGGAIGFIGFNDDFNHAIIIRSFLSKNHRLYYQAGAGVVAKSDPYSELQEVENKLAALKKAMEGAEKIGTQTEPLELLTHP
jgi:anthranilate synthase component 1